MSLLLLSSLAALRCPGVSSRGETVVLIHGLGRTSLSMKRVQWTLERNGYGVVNNSYASTGISLEDAANYWLPQILSRQECRQASRVHFVTHSAGGIVLRCYLQNHSVENLGRVVMLAPPNRGSELADRLKNRWLYKFVTGRAGQELGTEGPSLPLRLPAANFELGIIAGDRSLNPLFSSCIPDSNDGKVSVRRAAVEGMSAFKVVHGTHTWIMWRADVNQATLRFLAGGQL